MPMERFAQNYGQLLDTKLQESYAITDPKTPTKLKGFDTKVITLLPEYLLTYVKELDKDIQILGPSDFKIGKNKYTLFINLKSFSP